jgi:hypothetical protein
MLPLALWISLIFELIPPRRGEVLTHYFIGSIYYMDPARTDQSLDSMYSPIVYF